MKFVHAADLHLDSPLLGLERYEGAPVEQIRSATRRAMQNLVELCREETADLLVIAGDLYDGDWRDYATGLFFAQQMAELRAADVRVVWLRGNHDAESRLTKHLRLPETVFELPARRAESVIFEDLGVALHGQGFQQAAVTDDLSARYPSARRDLLNIGVLHTALEGREGHARYAPCQLAALINKGYEYWALGHVHQREVLHSDPWIVFSGNLQGRHAREVGPKGATLVDTSHGRIKSVEHRALDDVRWQVCQVSALGARTWDDVLERSQVALKNAAAEAEDRLLLARVRITGVSKSQAAMLRNPEHLVQELRSLALDLGGAGVWIEKLLIDRAGPASSLAQQSAALAALDSLVREIASSDADLAQLQAEFRDLLAKLPGDDFAPRLKDLAGMRALLDETHWFLEARLSDPEAEGAS